MRGEAKGKRVGGAEKAKVIGKEAKKRETALRNEAWRRDGIRGERAKGRERREKSGEKATATAGKETESRERCWKRGREEGGEEHLFHSN